MGEGLVEPRLEKTPAAMPPRQLREGVAEFRAAGAEHRDLHLLRQQAVDDRVMKGHCP